MVFSACPAARAQETPRVERYLADLFLGDSVDRVKKTYRPLQSWPSHEEPGVSVTRLLVKRGAAKDFPRSVETMWLGMRRGRLVEIQVVYDAKYTRRKPVEAVARDLSLVYGEPRHTNDRFWWTDGKSVLRVFYVEVPVVREGRRAVELRTSLQLLEADLFRRPG